MEITAEQYEKIEVVPVVRTGFRVLKWKNYSVRRRGGGNVKIGFIDFQGLWEGKQFHRFPGFPSNRHFHGLLPSSLCRLLFLRPAEVYLIRRLGLQAWMGATIIEELDVLADSASGFADRVVSMQINLFVFDRAPEAFHKNIVTPAAFAVHADGDALLLQSAGEVDTGELAALIGVEDLGPAVLAQSLIESLQAK